MNKIITPPLPYKPGLWLLVLLPLLFAVHHAAQDALVIRWIDVISFTSCFSALALLVYFLLQLISKNKNPILLLVTQVLLIYLFWGYWYDGITALIGKNIITKIPVLLVILTVIATLIAIGFSRLKRNSQKSVFIWLLYSSIAVIIYDGLQWRNATQIARNEMQTELATHPLPPAIEARIDEQATHWNVAVLLYDALAGTQSLNRNFHYDNSDLDTFLLKKGFRVIAHPKSNYQSTTFSMASLLNARYLSIPDQEKFEDRKNQIKVRHLITENEIIKSYIKGGYKINNLSIFDFTNNPSHLAEHFVLPVGFNLLQYNTLYGRLAWFISRNYQDEEAVMSVWNYNKEASKKLLAVTGHEASPQFTYAHFMLPHLPYYYDSMGKILPTKKIKEVTEQDLPQYYLYQLPVANQYIQASVTHLINSNTANTCILLLSDHGYGKKRDSAGVDLRFYNYIAVYYPDEDYSGLYDSVTNVNVIRHVVNRTLGTALPLLPDSTVSYFVQDDI